MSRPTVIALFACALLTGPAAADDALEAALARARPSPAEERWRLVPLLDSLAEAFRRAEALGRPVFYFGADGILDTGNC